MITGRYVSYSKTYCSEKTLPKKDWEGKEVGGKPCPREGYLGFPSKNPERLVCYSHFVRLSKEKKEEKN